MRAVTVREGRLALGEVDEPAAFPSSAVVDVRAISLNRGEVKTALSPGAEGSRPGWDFAGVVERAPEAAPDMLGRRVFGLLPTGAWAERVAAPAFMLATIPDGVSFEQAAALPVAGMTAAHALAKRGPLAGLRVLVTGATGGVGMMALQLARNGGAKTVALVRDERRAELVAPFGAEPAIGMEAAGRLGPYDLILESVGGDTLGQALGHLAPRGVCVLFGASDTPVTTFDASRFRVGGTSLYGLFLGEEIQHAPPEPWLSDLARAVADGSLDPMISVVRPWTDIGAVADELMARGFSGKAVLTLG